MSDRKRILFVDDDPSILAGLKGVLFRDRKRWDMVFAQGGDAAIAELETGSFDAIVSDMRMPGIDGAMLLDRVHKLTPETRRVILSGSADADDVQRAAAAAEEVLTKPCDARTLRATLERLLLRAAA